MSNEEIEKKLSEILNRYNLSYTIVEKTKVFVLAGKLPGASIYDFKFLVDKLKEDVVIPCIKINGKEIGRLKLVKVITMYLGHHPRDDPPIQATVTLNVKEF